ncbi:CotO family spore coat protein [Bacillaceae bacterium W0354]
MADYRTKPPVLFISQRNEPNLQLVAQSVYYSQSEQGKMDEATPADESNDKKSSFQALSIDEKLNYLVSSSDILPKLKCKIITNKTSYNGVIESYDDPYVEIKLTKTLKRVRLMKNDIQEILLMGF